MNVRQTLNENFTRITTTKLLDERYPACLLTLNYKQDNLPMKLCRTQTYLNIIHTYTETLHFLNPRNRHGLRNSTSV